MLVYFSLWIWISERFWFGQCLNYLYKFNLLIVYTIQYTHSKYRVASGIRYHANINDLYEKANKIIVRKIMLKLIIRNNSKKWSAIHCIFMFSEDLIHLSRCCVISLFNEETEKKTVFSVEWRDLSPFLKYLVPSCFARYMAQKKTHQPKYYLHF